MDDLVAFVSARLDEDEALARQAAQVAGPDWTWRTEVPEGGDYPTDYITSPDGTPLLDTMGGIEADAPHVARHDPARALREVEHSRLIMAVCLAAGANWDDLHAYPAARLGRAVLRHLAAIWDDHPDYRPEWKP